MTSIGEHVLLLGVTVGAVLTVALSPYLATLSVMSADRVAGWWRPAKVSAGRVLGVGAVSLLLGGLAAAATRCSAALAAAIVLAAAGAVLGRG